LGTDMVAKISRVLGKHSIDARLWKAFLILPVCNVK